MDFYTLTHVRTVIYDNDFQRISAYPENSCDFCTLLKENPISKARCRKDDTTACKICKDNNALYTYRCHAGLIEAVAPIKMNDLTLGYIMFGQVRHVDTDEATLRSYASKFIADPHHLIASVKKLKVRSDKQINAIAGIMEACTSYLWIAELIKVDDGSQIYSLTDYINNNICSDLSVDQLCSTLKVSRTRLYEIAHKYYGMSIAKYIRQKRISLAAKSIRENDLPFWEIAKSIGIDDGNYFSKVFKEEMGMTPTQYRKLQHP